jgi:hypothetical protein
VKVMAIDGPAAFSTRERARAAFGTVNERRGDVACRRRGHAGNPTESGAGSGDRLETGQGRSVRFVISSLPFLPSSVIDPSVSAFRPSIAGQ